MSRSRTPTINPQSDATTQITKLHYNSPQDKQFIMYSLIQKQSGFGVISHQRLLLFDSISKTLRYYSKPPVPLPDTKRPIPEGKQIIFIKKVKFFQFKSTKTGIGKAIIKWTDPSSEGSSKKQWAISFHSNSIMSQWIITINQAIIDRHLYSEDRPKQQKKEIKPKVQKYMTPFMIDTGGYESRRSSMSGSNFRSSSQDSNKNQKWFAESIRKKQEQFGQIHKERHNIKGNVLEKDDASTSFIKIHKVPKETQQQLQPQRTTGERPANSPQTSLKQSQKSKNFQFGIPKMTEQRRPSNFQTIDEVEDQSKFSKRSETQLANSQSTKKFRVNRPLPDKIMQQYNEDVSYSHVRVEEHRSDMDGERSSYDAQTNQAQIQNFINKLRKQNQPQELQKFPNPSQKPAISTVNNEYQLKQPQYVWVDQKKFYPQLYSQFMKKCKQISAVIIQNLPAFLQEAESKPSTSLYVKMDQLRIKRKNIQFIVPLMPIKADKIVYNDIYFESYLKMHQYSSVNGYIFRQTQTGFPLSTVQNHLSTSSSMLKSFFSMLPIPYCIITYQWYQIKCKAILPTQKFKKIEQEQYQKVIDNYFEIPGGYWTYYRAISDQSANKIDDNDGVIVVDFVSNTLVIESEPEDKVIADIAAKLIKRQTPICNIRDLQMYCYNTKQLPLSQKTISRLLAECISQCPPQAPQPHNRFPPAPQPIISALVSILYSIRCAYSIKQYLFSKIHKISYSEFYEILHTQIKEIVSDWTATKIGVTAIRYLQPRVETLRGRVRDDAGSPIGSLLDKYCIYSNILHLLQLKPLGKHRASQVPHSSLNQTLNSHIVKFQLICHSLNSENLSKQINEISKILKFSQIQNWGESKRSKGYEVILQELEKFQCLWELSTTTAGLDKNDRSRRTSNRFQKNQSNFHSESYHIQLHEYQYLNNYYPILYYISLYQPYSPSLTEGPGASTPKYNYNFQLQWIIQQIPPCYYTYLIGINCIKWISKCSRNTMNNYQIIQQMIYEQLSMCRAWFGNRSLYILMYYELWAVYNQQLLNIAVAVDYARKGLEAVIQIFGQSSSEAAQWWFLLANIMMDGELYIQALQAYSKTLQILKIYQLQQYHPTSSRNSLSLPESTSQAQLTIRLKLMKIYLCLQSVEKCIQQCSICLLTCQSLPVKNIYIQLQIFGTIIRCYEINGETSNLLNIIEIVSEQFDHQIKEDGSETRQMIAKRQQMDLLEQKEQIRENIMKICLSPAIRYTITERNRRQYLLKLTRAVRNKYQHRYNKKQYNTYLNKHAYQVVETRQRVSKQNPPNIISWFLAHLQQLPIFSSLKQRDRSNTLENLQFSYSLYENAISSKIQPVTQPKLLVPTMRAIEAVGGVLGFAYLQGCFQD